MATHTQRHARRWGLILVGMFWLAGCSSKFEQDFIESCVASSGEKPVCTCIYKNIEAEYGRGYLNRLTENDTADVQTVMNFGLEQIPMCQK